MSEKRKPRSDKDIRADLSEHSGIGAGGGNKLAVGPIDFVGCEVVGEDLEPVGESAKAEETPVEKAA